MPWEKAYDETEVLDRAMRAFWARGYEATSMAHLVEATGINRGSIYAAFASKHGLFLEALRHYDRIHRAEFLDRIAQAHGPREAIIATFEAAALPGDETGRPGGCLIVNSVLELAPHDSVVRDLVDASLAAVEAFFRSRLEASIAEGTVPHTIKPDETAQALLGLFLGLRVLARGRPRPATAAAITAQARAMLS